MSGTVSVRQTIECEKRASQETVSVRQGVPDIVGHTVDPQMMHSIGTMVAGDNGAEAG
jgi:hypothetical protein